MKIFEIWNEEDNCFLGVLLYYEKEKSFIIELKDDLDEWTAPLLLSSLARKKTYTIPRDVSLLWVQERIIPPSRQNIKSILNTHHLREYDEAKFLELSEGRCSQDYLCVKKTKELPDYVKKRQQKNLTECCVLSDHILLCVFADDTVRKIALEELKDIPDVNNVLKSDRLFSSVKVGTGGYCITFNNSIDIPASVLYVSGIKLPLTSSDLMAFVRYNILDTSECCETLECSRQNLSYMIRHSLLTPVKEYVKGNLFMKGDVIKNLW